MTCRQLMLTRCIDAPAAALYCAVALDPAELHAHPPQWTTSTCFTALETTSAPARAPKTPPNLAAVPELPSGHRP